MGPLPLSHCARTKVLARLGGLFSVLRNGPSAEVRTVALLCAQVLRTTTGSIIRLVEEDSGLSVCFSTTTKVRIQEGEGDGDVSLRRYLGWRVP